MSGGCHFFDQSHTAIRELWRFIFCVRRVTILTSSTKSSVSASRAAGRYITSTVLPSSIIRVTASLRTSRLKRQYRRGRKPGKIARVSIRKGRSALFQDPYRNFTYNGIETQGGLEANVLGPPFSCFGNIVAKRQSVGTTAVFLEISNRVDNG